jgi:SPP1 family predicted phage head-tail adaptor
MRISDLRRRVVIQSRSSTLDTWGQQVNTWVDQLTNCPAFIEALDGRERLAAMQISSEISHRITVRYSSLFAVPADVGAWRVTYSGRIFNIHAAMNPDERNR